jgi:hypothetical protein
MRSFLLGVDNAVSVRVQSRTNMKNSESWEKALFDRVVISSHPKALTRGQSTDASGK